MSYVPKENNWVARLYDSAGEHGYTWNAGEIGKVVKPLVERLGEEKVERAWRWWVANAADMGEPTRSMNPRSFVRNAGHWLYMSSPVKL